MIRKELMDQLVNLEIEAYETDSVFMMKGPTWLINERAKLEHYLDDFENDEIGSLRDYAAIAAHSLTPFFTDSAMLDRKAKAGIIQPVDELLRILPDFRGFPSYRYFFGGDLSVSGDSTGISMVHMDFMTLKVVLDFSLEIKAKRGERVDYSTIRQLIYNLRDRGFNIVKCCFDQFQSNDCINTLISNGFDAVQVQYADSLVGCTQLHELIHTDRFIYGDCNETFIGEAKELQIVNSKRIDHLMSEGKYNSKDVWDSVVNATVECLNDYHKYGNELLQAQKEKSLISKMVATNRELDLADTSWLI